MNVEKPDYESLKITREMKVQTILLTLLIFILISPVTDLQAQDRSHVNNPFLKTTAQTDERLNDTFGRQNYFPTPAHLTDQGPVWEGLKDMTAFGDRMEYHLRSAEEAIQELLDVFQSRTVANTITPYIEARDHFDNADRLARVALNVHPDSSYRAFAQEWRTRISGRNAEFEANPKIYEALRAIDLTSADSALKYVINKEIKEYERNGVTLSGTKRQQLAKLRSKISRFGNRFERNIFTATPTLQLHKDSLKGLPSDWIDNNPPDKDGNVIVQANITNLQPLLFFADFESTRLKTFKAFTKRAFPENFSVLDSLRVARFELAQLLGYESWADYVMEPMMAGSPERVRQFLINIDRRAAKAIKHEKEELLAMNQANQTDANSIQIWNSFYLSNQLSKEKYAFDTQAIREYLPYDRVRDGMFNTFEKMFSIEIRSAPETPVWHNDVEPYEVWEEGVLIGRFYLDMHPREGKFSGGASLALRLGDNTIPEVSLISNIPGAGDNEPGLLTPIDMNGFFHEFGHLVHEIFMGNQAIIGETESDFIEAPSQLLEEWAKSPQVLMNFARHYETGETFPEDLVQNYRRSLLLDRTQNANMLYRSFLSLNLYTTSPQGNPATDVEKQVLKEYFQYEPSDWFHPATFLPHLYPYSSNYYTYLWSEVIARDLLTAFNQDNLLDPEVGRRYRETILARAGTAPIEELIEEFLGRSFNAKAWEEWINGGVSDKNNTKKTGR